MLLAAAANPEGNLLYQIGAILIASFVLTMVAGALWSFIFRDSFQSWMKAALKGAVAVYGFILIVLVVPISFFQWVKELGLKSPLKDFLAPMHWGVLKVTNEDFASIVAAPLSLVLLVLFVWFVVSKKGEWLRSS